MSLRVGEPWSYGGYKFFGVSLAGVRTAISMPELSISFDVAQGFPFLFNMHKYFISHGHLDHAAGIPYIISQKMMTSQKAGEFYMPPSLVAPLTEIMNLWSQIEGFAYNYKFIPVKADDEIEINNHHFIKVFQTTHRVESFGYTLFENKKKLKTEYLNFNKDQIVDLRKQGVEVNEMHQTPMVTFTGDTQIEFLNERPWITKSKILILEATYLDSQRSVERAREWGHTHLDEIIPHLDEIESERIVLIHASSRYTEAEAHRILRDKIPAKHHERVVFFPGR
ncbi:MAG: MBL fold metallo-hydrolase [Bdellovibrionota bacterium]